MKASRLLVAYLALLALNFLYVPWKPAYVRASFRVIDKRNNWVWTSPMEDGRPAPGLFTPDVKLVFLRACAILVFSPLVIMAWKRKVEPRETQESQESVAKGGSSTKSPTEHLPPNPLRGQPSSSEVEDNHSEDRMETLSVNDDDDALDADESVMVEDTETYDAEQQAEMTDEEDVPSSSSEVEVTILKSPVGCHLWHLENLTRDDLNCFEQVETYYGHSHLDWSLVRCRQCGQLYFFESYEFWDGEDGGDSHYDTYVPVSAPEETLDLRITNILSFVPRIQSNFPAGADEPQVFWVRSPGDDNRAAAESSLAPEPMNAESQRELFESYGVCGKCDGEPSRSVTEGPNPGKPSLQSLRPTDAQSREIAETAKEIEKDRQNRLKFDPLRFRVAAMEPISTVEVLSGPAVSDGVVCRVVSRDGRIVGDTWRGGSWVPNSIDVRSALMACGLTSEEAAKRGIVGEDSTPGIYDGTSDDFS